MFGLLARQMKNMRVYCVLFDRTKRHLLPIIKSNVLTNVFDDEENQNIPENQSK